MAAEVARALDRSPRAVVARKVGAPGHEELASAPSDPTALPCWTSSCCGVSERARVGSTGRWLAHAGAAHRMLALPVGPPDTLARLRADYDDVFELAEPEGFVAVGQFYRSFIQATDDEVRRLLS